MLAKVHFVAMNDGQEYPLQLSHHPLYERYLGVSNLPARVALVTAKVDIFDGVVRPETSSNMVIATIKAIANETDRYIQHGPAGDLLGIIILWLPSLALGLVIMWYTDGEMFEEVKHGAEDDENQAHSDGQQHLAPLSVTAISGDQISSNSPILGLDAIDHGQSVSEGVDSGANDIPWRSREHPGSHLPKYKLVSCSRLRQFSVPEFWAEAVALGQDHQRGHHFLL